MKKLLLLFLLITVSVETHNISNAYKLADYEDPRQSEIERIATYYNQDYELIKYIFDVCGNFDIDPILFVSLIKIESDFIEDARSYTGAVGYCQITTIVLMDLNVDLDRRNAKENILIGAMFLNKLIGRYGDITNALKHYNAGSDLERANKYARNIFREYKRLKI